MGTSSKIRLSNYKRHAELVYAFASRERREDKLEAVSWPRIGGGTYLMDVVVAGHFLDLLLEGHLSGLILC